MTVRALVFLACLALACGCKSSSKTVTGPMEAPPPTGPTPVVLASLGFGDPPLEGFLYLRPAAGTANWRYAIDLDGDGNPDHEGVMTREIGFAYRFASPGVYRMRVSLTGPGGVEVFEVPAVVNDPAAVQMLAQRDLSNPQPPYFDQGTFEGIALNHASTALFVGDFFQSEIHHLDPATLADLGPPLPLRPGLFDEEVFAPGGAEGLSVTPSDAFLFVAHKGFGLSVIGLPNMELLRSLQMDGEFFIEALDDVTALVPGRLYREGLNLIDTRTGETIRTLPAPDPWHFAVSPATDRVAVLVRTGQPLTLRVASLSSLQELVRIPLPELSSADIVAFDPAGDRAYVMGNAPGRGSVFVLIDVITGRVLLTMTLPTGCGFAGFCVANPVATLASGRFVAMERDGTYFVDTTLDLPRFYSDFGASVAASPLEDVVFLLRPDGLVTKARIVE
jgi:hypothetical protein